MSRLAYPDPPHVAEAMQEFPAPLWHVRVGQTVSHAPTLVVPYYNTSAAVLQEVELDPKLRQLAIIRVAEREGAAVVRAAAGDGELVDERRLGQDYGRVPERELLHSPSDRRRPVRTR
jgi:hypothetical protein